MRTRSLRLTRETLTPLGTEELASVIGGVTDPCVQIGCDYTYCIDCINDGTFEFCPTPTIPVELCV